MTLARGGSTPSFLVKLNSHSVLLAWAMVFDYPDGTLPVAAIPRLALMLAGGWRLLHRRG